MDKPEIDNKHKVDMWWSFTTDELISMGALTRDDVTNQLNSVNYDKVYEWFNTIMESSCAEWL